VSLDFKACSNVSTIKFGFRCANEKRKTMNGEDILWAMQNLGFDNYIEPLKVFLQKYRESSKQTLSGDESGAPGDESFNKFMNGNYNQ
jgi:hypothetical protein